MWSVPGTKALLRCVAIMGLCLRTVHIQKTSGSFAVSIWACVQYNRGCRFCLFVRYYMYFYCFKNTTTIISRQLFLIGRELYNNKCVCFYFGFGFYLFSLCLLCKYFFRGRGGGYWFQAFLGIWEGGIYENYLNIFFASVISK